MNCLIKTPQLLRTHTASAASLEDVESSSSVMPLSDALVEVYSEEIPSHLVIPMKERWHQVILDALKVHYVVPKTSVSYTSCHRLASVLLGVPAVTPQRTRKIKGPPLSAPQTAVEGFCKKYGIDRQDLQQDQPNTTTPGRVHYYWEENIPSQTIDHVLLASVCRALGEMWWPVRMRFASIGFEWIRPVRWVSVCVSGYTIEGSIDLDSLSYEIKTSQSSQSDPHTFEPLPNFAMIDAGKIKVCSYTMGHKLDNPMRAVAIERPQEYIETMKRHGVLMDENDRVLKLTEYLSSNNDPSLLPSSQQISGVENPFPVVCTIPNTTLPKTIKNAVIKEHLQSLPSESGKFCIVADAISNQSIKEHTKRAETIRSGFEWVLRSRFDDAIFSWGRDQKRSIESMAQALDKMQYHRHLFSVLRYTDITVLALHSVIAQCKKAETPDTNDKSWVWLEDNKNNYQHFARWLSYDLITDTVREFPHLQGLIGQHLATLHKESDYLCHAIAYRHQKTPGSIEKWCDTLETPSILMIFADWINTLVCLWIAGEKPTGSGDPFAQKRIGNAIVGIAAQKINIDIASVVSEHVRAVYECIEKMPVSGDAIESLEKIGSTKKSTSMGKTLISSDVIVNELKNFLNERFEVYINTTHGKYPAQERKWPLIIHHKKSDLNPFQVMTLDKILRQVWLDNPNVSIKDIAQAIIRIHNILQSEQPSSVREGIDLAINNSLAIDVSDVSVSKSNDDIAYIYAQYNNTNNETDTFMTNNDMTRDDGNNGVIPSVLSFEAVKDDFTRRLKRIASITPYVTRLFDSTIIIDDNLDQRVSNMVAITLIYRDFNSILSPSMFEKS